MSLIVHFACFPVIWLVLIVITDAIASAFEAQQTKADRLIALSPKRGQ
jgi:hypothetical protein